MIFPEYTPKRAETLYKLEFPTGGAPEGIRLLWIDTLAACEIADKICCDTHAHTFFELHFILCGSARYEICGKVSELKGGTVLFLPPMTPHRFISNDGEFLRSTVLFSVAEQQHDEFYGKAVRIFPITDDVASDLSFILKKCDSPDVFTPAVIAGRTAEIIHSVLPHIGITPPPLMTEGKDPRVLAAIRYIENNRHRIISCDDVASECCLSAKQLGRLFRHTVGMSLYEYISDTKMQYAKYLLTVSSLSVKETAFMLGFDSESGFAAFFKRREGVPPGIYKQNQHM